MKRSELHSDPEVRRAFVARGQRASAAAAVARRRPISPASLEQRAAVRGQRCVVCTEDHVIHPAHLIDRSLCPTGADDARAVVPLCPTHHRLYDDGGLSLLEYLEPRHRVELAFAVERFGLISTLNRVTGERWAPGASL